MNHSLASMSALAASLLLGFVPLVACSSSHAPPPVAEGDFNAQYADIVCGESESCCGIAKYPYDKAACVAEWHRENDVTPVSGLTYNAQYAGECIARLHAVMASCDEPTPGPALAGFEFYCQAVYTGAKQPSESCSDVGECAASPDGFLVCDAGICKVSPANREGDVCFAKDALDDCGEVTGEAGLYCGSDARCHRKVGVGAACTSHYACDRTGYCSGGVCVARGGEGMPCSSAMPCARDQHCPSDANGNVSGVCTPRKHPGEACVEGQDSCFDGACSEGRCSSTFATADFCAGKPPPSGG